MRTYFGILPLLSLPALLAPLSALAGGAPSVATITQKLDDLYRSSSSVGKMELLSKTETQTRHLKMRMWSKGTRDKTLIIIDDPAREAGTATLKVGQNLWNYLPKISRYFKGTALTVYDGTSGPNDWGINSDARLTAVVVQKGKVVKSIGYVSLNETDAPEVIEALKTASKK